jgi:carboxylesterase
MSEKAQIVFVHGFLGHPRQFDSLAGAVTEYGFCATTVLLHGHGGSGFSFAKSTLKTWEYSLRQALTSIPDDSPVILIGHSIGGLLSLCAAAQSKFNIKGVVLISSPMKIYFLNPKSVTNRIRIAFASKHSSLKQAYKNALGIHRIFPSCLLWARVLWQPHKLIRKTKQVLSRITCPVLIFNSRKDETTSFKSVRLFERFLVNAPREICILNDAYHAYYPNSEKRIIQEKVLSFISNANKADTTG